MIALQAAAMSKAVNLSMNEHNLSSHDASRLTWLYMSSALLSE